MNKRLKALFSAMLVCMLVVLAACGTDTKDTEGTSTGADGAVKAKIGVISYSDGIWCELTVKP